MEKIKRPHPGKSRDFKLERKTKSEAQLEMRLVLKRIAQGEDLWDRKRHLNALINNYNK